MNKEKYVYVSVASVTMLAAIVFGATLVHALWYAPEVEVAPPAPAVASVVAPGDYPVRLQIPSLSIDAAVQQAGITAAGRMGVPSNFTDVAWYKYGPLPGQLGSAVIDGHVDNGLGLDGVFKHLGNIQLGDELDVQTKGGKTLRFIVSDIRSYPYLGVPTNLVFNQTGAARLNLITCEGNWVSGAKTYDQRLVVFAVLKSQSST